MKSGRPKGERKMFKKGVFDRCPTVLALLRRDVPRPVTLPEPIEWDRQPAWLIGDKKCCPMGLHPQATNECPTTGTGIPGYEVEFPAPDCEVQAFAKVWDALDSSEVEDAIEEIWPLN